MRSKHSVFCLVLALCLTLGTAACLSSCGDNSPVILRFGQEYITENEFVYELALSKTQYLSENSLQQDDPLLWAQKVADGSTVGEACMHQLKKSLVLRLYFADLARSKGFGLTQEEEELVRNSVDKMVANFSTRAEFDRYMGAFRVGYDQILRLMRQQYLSQKGQALCFAQGAPMEVTQQDAVEYFTKNFVTVKHVFVNNVNITYPNNKTVPLTPEQVEEKNAKIATLRQSLTVENFDTYLSQSEDFFSKKPQAVTLQRGESGLEEYDRVAFEAQVGQIEEAVTPNGVFFILRQSLDSTYLTQELTKALQAKLTQKALDGLYDTYLPQCALEAALWNQYSFSTAPSFTAIP